MGYRFDIYLKRYIGGECGAWEYGCGDPGNSSCDVTKKGELCVCHRAGGVDLKKIEERRSGQHGDVALMS